MSKSRSLHQSSQVATATNGLDESKLCWSRASWLPLEWHRSYVDPLLPFRHDTLLWQLSTIWECFSVWWWHDATFFVTPINCWQCWVEIEFFQTLASTCWITINSSVRFPGRWQQKLQQGTNKKSFVVVNLVDILVENINVVQQNVWTDGTNQSETCWILSWNFMLRKDIMLLETTKMYMLIRHVGNWQSLTQERCCWNTPCWSVSWLNAPPWCM